MFSVTDTHEQGDLPAEDRRFERIIGIIMGEKVLKEEKFNTRFILIVFSVTDTHEQVDLPTEDCRFERIVCIIMGKKGLKEE